MCNRLGTIPVCDRQTNRRASCHGIVCAMHTRRTVKIYNRLFLVEKSDANLSVKISE